MSYPRIAAKVAREVWSLEPNTFKAILDALNGQSDQVAMGETESRLDEMPQDFRADGVAVIPVHGIIGKHLSQLEMDCGGCSLDAVGAMFDAAAADEEIAAIVLDINSPGGTVTGVPELSAKISASEKPVFAFTDSQCCSAALWLAHSADRLYSTESAHIGSVGAYILLMDASRAIANDGFKPEPVYQGKFKLAGANFKPLTDDERAMFQASVDKTVTKFKAVVNARHTIAAEHLEGQVFDGEDATLHGFTDGLVTDLQEVVDLIKP